MAIGAYAVERDYSHYIAYLSKTVLAVVGTATKGPVGKPIYTYVKKEDGTTEKVFSGYEGVATVCTSAQDLVNKFGPLKTNCYALYAGQYFLSQASKLYFVRAVSASAAEPSVSINATYEGEDHTAEDAFKFSLLEKSIIGNGYTLEITSNEETETTDPVAVAENPILYKATLKDGNTVLETVEFTLDQLVEGQQFKYMTLTKNAAPTLTVSNSSYKLVSMVKGTYEFAGGNDGIEDITPGDYINAAQALTADTVDMNLFAVPGVSDSAVITSMLDLAANRGDSLYLVDPPKELTRDGVIDWHNGTGSYENTTLFDSSYGALYYDWVTIYDSVNKVKVQVPPSVPVAASIAYSDRTSELWYAPAGLNRGLVRGVLDSVTKLNKSDVSLLYEGDNNINSIYEDPQVGLVLWGQKTLHRAETALNRINVRRLMNYLKRVVTAACNYLTFEPNDRATWNSFEMKVKPILDSIKARRGIYEYSIVRGETIVTNEDVDNYRMPCMIMIRPTKAAEEIPIYFVITSTGADFNEVLESNGVIV